MFFSTIQKIVIEPKYFFVRCNYAYRLIEDIEVFKGELDQNTFCYIDSNDYFESIDHYLQNDDIDQNIINSLREFEQVNFINFNGVVVKVKYNNYESVISALDEMNFCGGMSWYNSYQTTYFQTTAGNILYTSIENSNKN